MRYFLLLFVLNFTRLVAQPTTGLVVPIKDSLHSKILNEKREIWVYVPATNSSTGPRRFETMYLLDAEPFFTLVNGMVHLKSEFERSCPKMIIVGVTNTDRVRDFTPTHSLISSNGKKDENMLKTSGGAENFSRFLKEELIPYIDSKYPTTTERTLLGHSLAGLHVLHTLVQHPNHFDNYVAIDPSIWWDDQKLLKLASTELLNDKVSGKTFLLAFSAGVKPNAKPTENHEANALTKFATEMAEKSKARFAWKKYDNESHASVIYPALNEALEMLK